MPAIHSRKAPPAAETRIKWSATPALLRADTVSPPPGHRNKLAAPRQIGRRLSDFQGAVVKGGVSKTPSGPFQISVSPPSMARRSPASVSGPASRIRSSSPTSPRRRTKVGAPSARFATTTTSEGSSSSQSLSRAACCISRAVAARVFSQKLAPTDYPCAKRKVWPGRADGQPVQPSHQVLQQVELAGRLGAHDDPHHGVARLSQHPFQLPMFALQRQTGKAEGRWAIASVEAWARWAAEKASLT